LGVDAVIQVQKKFENKDFSETKHELKTIFDRIQLKLDAK
jgi:RNase P protein component